jgi:predicted nuclease with TOPRIM domain
MNVAFYIVPKRYFEKEDRILSVSTPLGSTVIDGLLKITFDAKMVDDEIYNTLVKGGNKMTDIETLKSFNPKNLSEGKRQAEEEKANYEASEAKKSYTALINQKEELERIIKTTNEELKKVKESLAVFK